MKQGEAATKGELLVTGRGAKVALAEDCRTLTFKLSQFRDLSNEHSELSMARVSYLLNLTVLLLLLLLTNRYLSVAIDSQLLPGDSFSYLRIANAFPRLPLHSPEISAHHAQRFVIPYVVGAFSRLIHLPLEASFRVFAIGAIVAIVGLLCKILQRLRGLSCLQSFWLIALLILNPYSFRVYIADPWLLNDLFFQVGLTILLFGLFEESAGTSLLGVSLAICSRQTGLLLTPPMLLWLALLWPQTKRKRAILTGVFATTIILTVYMMTSYVALRISGQLVSSAPVTGFFTWIEGSPSIKTLLEFGLRGVIGLTFPIAILLGTFPNFSSLTEWSRDDRVRLGCLLGFSAMITAQPVLGGPAVTGRDITRLVLLGLIPVLVALAILFLHTTLRNEFWQQALPLFIVTAAVGSFHHMYSFLGVGNGADRTAEFVVVYFGCATLLFWGLKVLAMPNQRSVPAP